MTDNHQQEPQVSAIITAMTDAEEPFLQAAVRSVLADSGIGQVILCIEEKNTWFKTVLGSLLNDPRLEVLQIPLAPLGAVRNRALKYVRLPWVAYCDGDDEWCLSKTMTQLSYALEKGCDFVGADHYLMSEQGKIRAFAPARYIPMPSSWMVRTEIMRQHPFHEEPFSLRQEESGEWWHRTSGIVKRARCSKALLRYRIRPNSLSMKTASMQRKAKIVALAEKPVLGAFIFVLSWFTWAKTRQTEYLWCKDWGQEPTVEEIRRGQKKRSDSEEMV